MYDFIDIEKSTVTFISDAGSKKESFKNDDYLLEILNSLIEKGNYNRIDLKLRFDNVKFNSLGTFYNSEGKNELHILINKEHLELIKSIFEAYNFKDNKEEDKTIIKLLDIKN